MKENYIVLEDEDGRWLITSDIAEKIKDGEDFEFNARLDDEYPDDISTYKRISSADDRVRLKMLKKKEQ